jgi:hypothetical protein
MDERAADAEVVSIDDLLERVRREGPVLRFNNDVVGIFDPALAVRIDKANTDQHTVPDSLIDFLGLRSGRDPVAWREVRALLSEQAGRLASQPHADRTRMHGFLAQRADRPHDLSELSWWTISQSLLPMLIDGLSRSDVDALIGEQKTRYNAIVLQNFSFWRRIIDFHLSAARRARCRGTSGVVRARPCRARTSCNPLPLVQRVGVDCVAYLVSMVLAGMSGLPGITAASLLYAMHRFPHWQARIREETSALSLEQLYALPIKSLPCHVAFRQGNPAAVAGTVRPASSGLARYRHRGRVHPQGRGIRVVVLLPASFAGVLAEPGQLRS